MRRKVLWLNLVLALLVINGLIIHKENIKRNGRTVLLETGRADPRSLMQGDYMVLRYNLSRAARHVPRGSGHLVIALDNDGLGRFSRVYRGGDLRENEILIDYKNHDHIKVAAETYFFQEGKASELMGARYAKLKVSESGKTVIIGLLDGDFKELGRK